MVFCAGVSCVQRLGGLPAIGTTKASATTTTAVSAFLLRPRERYLFPFTGREHEQQGRMWASVPRVTAADAAAAAATSCGPGWAGGGFCACDDGLSVRLQHAVRKTPFLNHFATENDHFTKTGSG
jgi:hypothetical protein